jgi:diaminopimelate decarboxylase
MQTISNINIKQIAQEFGLPLYVYDKTGIEKNFSAIHDAFLKYYPRTKVCYSVKANNNINILKIIRDLGGNADVSSPVELALSQKAGLSNDRIIYTGNYESQEDIKAVFDSKVQINFDDVASYKKYLKHGKPDVLSFRINPGIGRGGFEGITTAGADAKFGIPYEMAYQVYKTAKDDGITKFGIHMMTGSNNLEPYHFAETTDKLLMIVTHVFSKLGAKLEYIDIGGGFGVPYTDDEQVLNLDETAKMVSDIIKEKREKYDFGEPDLIIEPGRYIVADAGYLLAEVTAVKNTYKKFIGLDAGMNTLIRQALYGANHRVEFYGKDKLHGAANICGNVCENSDIFAKGVFTPDVEEGDIVIFRDTGAYGYSMSSNYNGRLRPAEVLIEYGKARQIRKRETFDDIYKLMC